MKVTLKKGYRYTAPVIAAIAQAGKFDFSDNWVRNPNSKNTEGSTWKTGMKRRILCNGYEFNSPKAFGEHMLKQLNQWMFACKQADLDPILECRYQRTDFPFDIDYSN